MSTETPTPNHDNWFSRMDNKDKGVFLTYRASRCGDGMGAQAQRLMGIYGAARSLGLGYFHSPIMSLERNPGDPHTDSLQRKAFLQRVNQRFELPSDINSLPAQRLVLTSLSVQRAQWLRILHSVLVKMGIAVGVEISRPYPYADRYPDIYTHAAQIVVPRVTGPTDAQTSTFQIDLHIRRALAPKLGRDGSPYDRHVPSSWYERILCELAPWLRARGLHANIRIHTDLTEGRWKIPDDITEGTRLMWEHHNIVDSDGFLVDLSEDLEDRFHQFGSVSLAQGWDPLDAIDSMVKADLLLTCASSMSYVAGLLRTHGITVSPIFFHTCPETWHTLSPEPRQHELNRLIDDLSSQL